MNNPKEKHLFLPPILQLPSPAAEEVKKKITTKTIYQWVYIGNETLYNSHKVTERRLHQEMLRN